jgi:hypothetical protein
MTVTTFDSTDNPEAQQEQRSAEARALEVGEKLVNDQEAAEAEVYEKARKEAESQLNYAGKFRTAEDLEKAYLELEKKLGSAKQQAAEEEQPGEAPESAQEAPEEEPAQEEAQGEEKPAEEPEVARLSPEEEQSLIKGVGGLEFYNQALRWAAENLSPEEAKAFDQIITNGDRGAVTFAVKSLVQQFRANGDYDGAPVSGKAVRGQGAKPFRSQAELARAINNPKYREDPAYRLDVEQRLAVSGDLL